MSTIEDKLLDGPTIHYCDADNNDIRADEISDNDDDERGSSLTKNNATSLFTKPDGEVGESQYRQIGCSTNTGPKGVLEDYRKQSITKSKQTAIGTDDLEAEFMALMHDDDIIKQIAERRLALEKQSNSAPVFGYVLRLNTGSELLDAIDKENPNVLVIVHIYTRFSRICARVDNCLDKLASELKHIHIVTLDAGAAGLSENFKNNGVPALLAYRNGNLVKSLVQLEELLDKDFDHVQIRELLMDNDLVN